MVGIMLAFEDYSARGGFLFSEWIDLRTLLTL
jgi:ABC-type polysaccharide transport system permease subunit